MRRVRIYIKIVAVLLLMPSAKLFAQEDKGVFASSSITSYTQLNGLPQNSVEDFCFDNLGYLWIATGGGLSRFDGKNFKNDFGYNGSFSTKVRIKHFFKKGLDTIYALTSDLNIFVIANGNVVSFEEYAVTKHGILLQNAQATVPALPGIKDKYFIDYCHKNDWAIQFACLGYKGTKDTFALLGRAMNVYADNRLIRSVHLPPHSDSNIDHRYWNIYVLEDNVVIINDTTDNLDVYRPSGKVEHFLMPMQSKHPWKMYLGVDNHALFAANNNTLFEIKISQESNSVVFTKMLDKFPDSLNVQSICNVNNKYMVVSSGFLGFYVYYKKAAQTFSAPSKDVVANYFYAQALMPDNKTILTGINLLFDKNGFKEANKQLDPSKTESIDYMFINRAIYKDRNGFYWYLLRLPSPVRQFGVMKASYPGAPDAVQMKIVLSPVRGFFEDTDGNIWFNNNSTLGYLEKGSAKFVTIVPDTGKNYKLTQNITCYTQDNTGKILMGTSGGVFLIDPKTDAAPIKYLLDSTEIHYLSFDKQTGSLWIGTYGKGLWVLKKSGELVQFPLDKDKNMSIVHYAITDQQNRVWVSTNNGLYVTTKKNLQDFEAKRSTQVYYYRFSTYDGLIANEFNGGCQLPMILQPDGSLTVSSVAGLAWINTNDAPIDFSSKTLQTEITHGGKILPGAVQSLDIEAGDDSELSIAVLAPDWMPEYNIQLQYRIIKTGDHSQPLWQDVNEQHLVLLPFLSTGDYKLQFRKRTGLNNDDFIYHEITIQKRPYWYQTFYVYPIVLVLLVALGYLFYQWRVVTLRRKNRILKEKVIAATADLKEKNEELATTVKTRDSLILLFNHDLSTPLFYINRLAQSLADTDQIKEPYASDVQLLANSTQDLEEMMNEMLLWIQVQQKNVTIQLLNEPVNIKEVLEKNFDLFRHRLKYHNTITKYLISDELSIFSDKKILSSILYNLISNAIKYTSNGVIQMTAVNDERDSDKVHLIIQSKSDAREIIDTSSHNSTIELNDDTVTKDSADSGEQSRQIGLQLVKSFAAMLHLNIVIDNSIIGVFTVKISGLKLVRNA